MTLSVTTKQTVWEAGFEIVSIITGSGNNEVCITQAAKSSVNTIVMSRDQFEKLVECFEKA